MKHASGSQPRVCAETPTCFATARGSLEREVASLVSGFDRRASSFDQAPRGPRWSTRPWKESPDSALKMHGTSYRSVSVALRWVLQNGRRMAESAGACEKGRAER